MIDLSDHWSLPIGRVAQPLRGHLSLPFMCGPHFCSMKITEDVRKFAAQQQISEEDALKVGLEQKAKEFAEAGSEIYSKG